ncbi:MAG: hypothetical protein KDB26_07760 [Microthrixaceae bacterium]|nr:hypothetical protein [Microthrixaceae bacterium]
MTKIRMKTAAAVLALGGAASLLTGCFGGFYTDSSGKTCVIVLVFPICTD